MATNRVTRAEVPQSVHRMMDRAQKAMDQQNFGYACEILRNVLLAQPGYYDARMMLRQAQLEQVGYKASIFRQFIAAIKTAVPVYIKGPMALKKGSCAKALDLAEKAMEADPTLLSTLNFLKRAAEEAELTDVAINAMEVAVRFHPKSKKALMSLAELYQKQGQATKSVQVLQKLYSLVPGNLQVQGQLKHATALAAMEEAHWEEADSYRDLIKDKDLAQTLEQQERISARDPEARERLIKATLDKIEGGQPSAGDYRKLAELYRQDRNYEKAIEAYQKIFEVTGSTDPGIDAAITDTVREKYDAQIVDLQDRLEKEPDQAETIRKEIADLEEERDSVLLDRLRTRVENYPNEMQYRFELGMMYYRTGEIDAALKEFQQAQRNPHLANNARLYMAKCLSAKKLVDLALERLNEILEHREEITGSILKETLYDLAEAYEKKNDRDSAMTAWKELYGMDVNYRDVGSRLEAYYGEEGEETTAGEE